MLIRRSVVAASMGAAAAISIVGGGVAGAVSVGAAPTSTVPAPPPTCTCPTATTVAAGATTLVATTAAAPATAPVAATTAPVAATTTAAGPTTAPAAVPAAGLPADATLEQLQQAVLPILGPSTDVMGEFAVFGVTPPPGVPTPAGAVVEEFKFSPTDIDTDDRFYSGVLRLAVTQPAADVVVLYQTTLIASGYTQTGDSVDNTAMGQQIRRLSYDLPAATHFMSELTVSIIDHDVDYVEIEWTDSIDASIGAAFTSWTGLPLVDQAVAIEDLSIGNFISGDGMNIETDYLVPIAFAGFEQQLIAGLAGTPYTVDTEMSVPGEYLVLDGGPFDDLTVDFLQSSLDPAITVVSVDAQYAL